MVNHRLIKAVLTQQACEKPQDEVLARLQEARRQNRLVERDIADWLYCRYLADKVAENAEFDAEVQDVMRGGLRVQLLEMVHPCSYQLPRCIQIKMKCK